MSEAIAAGAIVGLATAAISEAMLLYWRRRPELNAMTVAVVGFALRAVWLLSALVVVFRFGWFDAPSFAIAALGAYLAAQVWEGFRYKRFIHSR